MHRPSLAVAELRSRGRSSGPALSYCDKKNTGRWMTCVFVCLGSLRYRCYRTRVTVVSGVGVPHPPPLGQSGVFVGVGVSHIMPGPQVGVASLVDVGCLV